MAQDVTNIWNDEAATYNFDTTIQAGLGATFGSAYNGPDFATDFYKILTAIDKIARPDGAIPPLGSTDPLLSSLENYPDNP